MTPPEPPPIRATLREIERAAFVATRALDEDDREAARVAIAIEVIRERVGRLPT